MRNNIAKQNNADADQIPIEFTDFNDFMAKFLANFDNNENQENSEFKLSCTVNITGLTGNFKEQAGYIIKAISDDHEYTWTYQKEYNVKKSNSKAFYCYCSQRDCLGEKPKKHSDMNKHHQYSIFLAKVALKLPFTKIPNYPI
ncbi:hypothetical protein C1645_839183 [Glomus cerebriforme]|uniref:Uncharacterized protein n=1 Tax=Glomus cerebriforme TaxID=658196 RepID=A0A397SBP4_9GLOM|nr:hypothetical protein C1645_839183 [Glomus cerebriforme]